MQIGSLENIQIRELGLRRSSPIKDYNHRSAFSVSTRTQERLWITGSWVDESVMKKCKSRRMKFQSFFSLVHSQTIHVSKLQSKNTYSLNSERARKCSSFSSTEIKSYSTKSQMNVNPPVWRMKCMFFRMAFYQDYGWWDESLKSLLRRDNVTFHKCWYSI